jgi:hypothetical protein
MSKSAGTERAHNITPEHTKIMRSISLTLMLLSLLFMSGACKRRHHRKPSDPASTINAGDPEFDSRFTEGFYNIEANAWRWTGKEFAVTLTPPPHSSERGAQLVVQIVVPDPVTFLRISYWAARYASISRWTIRSRRRAATPASWELSSTRSGWLLNR